MNPHGLDEEGQIGGQVRGLVEGLEAHPLHVEEGADVGPAMAGHHLEVGLLQVGLRHQDVLNGLGAHEVLQAAGVVEVEVGDDDAVDIMGGQPLGRQGVLDGDTVYHRVVVEHLPGIGGQVLRAVARVIEQIPQGGVLDKDSHGGRLHHLSLIGGLHQAKFRERHVSQIQYADLHTHAAFSFFHGAFPQAVILIEPYPAGKVKKNRRSPWRPPVFFVSIRSS